MNQRKQNLWLMALPMSLLLAASGCATKKYVAKSVAPVNQRVDALQTKQASDISQVNERIDTTDLKLGENTTSIATLSPGVANALNYKEVEKADVTFAYNKDKLTPEAKAALDQLASKVRALPRSRVDLVGFTDKTGSEDHNLSLSRRRAEAVQRYLVMQKVPVHAITIVGLGPEAPPEGLQADRSAINPNPSQADLDQLARRVDIRVFGAGDITQTTASSPSGAPVAAAKAH